MMKHKWVVIATPIRMGGVTKGRQVTSIRVVWSQGVTNLTSDLVHLCSKKIQHVQSNSEIRYSKNHLNFCIIDHLYFIKLTDKTLKLIVQLMKKNNSTAYSLQLVVPQDDCVYNTQGKNFIKNEGVQVHIFYVFLPWLLHFDLNGEEKCCMFLINKMSFFQINSTQFSIWINSDFVLNLNFSIETLSNCNCLIFNYLNSWLFVFSVHHCFFK